jgi:hypothetical protein
VIVVAHPSEIGGPDWPSETATVMQFRNERVVSMQDYRTEAEAIRLSSRSSTDAPRCRRRSVHHRLLSFLRFFRRESGCGDCFEELPPDSVVREPLRPGRPVAAGPSDGRRLRAAVDLARLSRGARGSDPRKRPRRRTRRLRATARMVPPLPLRPLGVALGRAVRRSRAARGADGRGAAALRARSGRRTARPRPGRRGRGQAARACPEDEESAPDIEPRLRRRCAAQPCKTTVFARYVRVLAPHRRLPWAATRCRRSPPREGGVDTYS